MTHAHPWLTGRKGGAGSTTGPAPSESSLAELTVAGMLFSVAALAFFGCWWVEWRGEE